MSIKVYLHGRSVTTNGAGTLFELVGNIPFGTIVSSINVPPNTQITMNRGTTYSTVTLTNANLRSSGDGQFNIGVGCTAIPGATGYNTFVGLNCQGAYIELGLKYL